jgi:hypothetical protein
MFEPPTSVAHTRAAASLRSAGALGPGSRNGFARDEGVKLLMHAHLKVECRRRRRVRLRQYGPRGGQLEASGCPMSRRSWSVPLDGVRQPWLNSLVR